MRINFLSRLVRIRGANRAGDWRRLFDAWVQFSDNRASAGGAGMGGAFHPPCRGLHPVRGWAAQYVGRRKRFSSHFVSPMTIFRRFDTLIKCPNNVANASPSPYLSAMAQKAGPAPCSRPGENSTMVGFDDLILSDRANTKSR